jgi:hypothetical protein
MNPVRRLALVAVVLASNALAVGVGPAFGPAFSPPAEMAEVVREGDALVGRTWPHAVADDLVDPRPGRVIRHLLTRDDEVAPPTTSDGAWQWTRPRYSERGVRCFWLVAYESMMRGFASLAAPSAKAEFLAKSAQLRSLRDRICKDPGDFEFASDEWNRCVNGWLNSIDWLGEYMQRQAMSQVAAATQAGLACAGVGGCPGAVPGHRPVARDVVLAFGGLVVGLGAGIGLPARAAIGVFAAP